MRRGIAVAVLLLAGAGAHAAGRPAHPFAYPDVNPRSGSHGEVVSLDDAIAGGTVVLNFVASWCGPCWKELPEFQQLYDNGVPIVAIAADEYTQPASDLLARLDAAGATMPVLLVPVDDIEAMERHYDHSMLPSTYVVDAEGSIRKVFQGLVPARRLLETVRSISAPSP